MTTLPLPHPPDLQTGRPRPPRAPTQGPTLEYFRESNRSIWISAPVAPIIVLLIGLWYGGPSVLTYWWVWALLAVYLAWLVHMARAEFIAAGVDWLQTKNGWVRTYELTNIRYLTAAPGAHQLGVTDRDNRKLVMRISLLQSNHRLWDYVYLGLRHSVANGATMNRFARAQFCDLAADAATPGAGRGVTDDEQSAEDDLA
jgi:hypothetical protein